MSVYYEYRLLSIIQLMSKLQVTAGPQLMSTGPTVGHVYTIVAHAYTTELQLMSKLKVTAGPQFMPGLKITVHYRSCL